MINLNIRGAVDTEDASEDETTGATADAADTTTASEKPERTSLRGTVSNVRDRLGSKRAAEADDDSATSGAATTGVTKKADSEKKNGLSNTVNKVRDRLSNKQDTKAGASDDDSTNAKADADSTE